MKWKTFLLFIFIAGLGVFVYLKIQVMGSPNSGFNQTTRFKLGQHPVLRTILGLHNSGDARSEYFAGRGPIAIEWFKPLEEDVDKAVLQKFADAVTKYTGRPTVVNLAGGAGDSTTELANLKSFVLKAAGSKPTGSSLLMVVFAKNYSPQPPQELSTTFQESGIVLSLDAHDNFLGSYNQNLDNYLLSSLLHEFGHQIGLGHNQDPACVMNEHAGIDGRPLEFYGKTDPQDFCPTEVDQINRLKAQY